MDKEPVDSGMASLDDSSKDATPEKPKAIVDAEHDEDDEDETYIERLERLTDMFPDSVRNFTGKVASIATTTVKGFYNYSRAGLWVVASSSLILLGPLVFEVERAQLEESQRSQQKQFLLGPNTMSGNLGPNMAMTSR